MMTMGLSLLAPALAANPPASESPPPEDNSALALAQALSKRYADLFAKYRSAVVRVTVPGKEDGRDVVKFWTGFFINRDGYVLTTNANHLQDLVRVTVEIGDLQYYAEVKALDPVTNLALLHVVSPPKDFTTVDLSHGAALPPLGTLVMAVTCKQLEQPGPSAGMVQGYNSSYESYALPAVYLRVTIQDDGGEIGSPVFDLEGRFQGIMVLSLPVLHSSLVLPNRAVSRVTGALLESGKVVYGRMGIVANPIRDGDAGMRLKISEVDVDGPARNAGLKQDDILLSIDGEQIHNHDDMRQAAFFAKPGQTVTVRVRRADKEMDLPLVVAELPVATPPPNQPGVPAPLPANPASGNATTTPPAASGNTTVAPPGPMP
jgi:S1-C subfamily serine protease